MKGWREFSIKGEYETREMAWAEAAREKAYRFGMEASGVNVPWIAQYFPELVLDQNETTKRRKSDDAHTIATLVAQQFERSWAATMARLGDLTGRAEALVETITDRLAKIEQALEALQSRAVTLSDGTRIYPDRDGNWRAEDGSVIDLEEAGLSQEGLPDGPRASQVSWEDFSALRDQRDAVIEVEGNAVELSIEIGEKQNLAHDAYENGDTDLLNDVGRGIQDLTRELEIIQSTVDRFTSAPSTELSKTQVTSLSAMGLAAIRPLEISLPH